MKWEQERGSSCWTAWSGEHRIGSVVPVTCSAEPEVAWFIHAVSGSRYQKAVRGECRTVKGAKKALRRAWRIWIKERGLVEVKP